MHIFTSLRSVNLLAISILAIMFFLMYFSMIGDSAIMDELAHIPAGYGYVNELDYRLNPEHPPLVKALSGLFVRVFANPDFPTDTKDWRDDINGQWGQGNIFLYKSGNDADQIIFWSRLPLVLLTVLFGWLFFVWTKGRFGSMTALLALTFFTFSPTILAHSRYVTTDLGAAIGFFIGIASFIMFLEMPTWRRTMIFGLALGAAQLLKFSLVLLAPILGVVFLIWIASHSARTWREWVEYVFALSGKITLAAVVALVCVWIVYTPFVWSYPMERQYSDAEFILGSYGFQPAVDVNLALIKHPITRPLAQYLLGVLMVQQRAAGGNTAYFLGEVSAAGSPAYFPILYLFKEPLSLHIFTVLVLGFCAVLIKRWWAGQNQNRTSAARHPCKIFARRYIIELSAIVFILVYWGISIRSNLNIGVRHIMPTLPFIYLLAARGVTSWIRGDFQPNPSTWAEWFQTIRAIYIKAIPKYIISIGLVFWFVASSLSNYPHFLAYYNELAGGAREGYRIAVDSNYDWGQDMIRLKKFVERNHIPNIAIAYFGGGDSAYYLGDKFEPWWSSRGAPSGWFAISATLRQGAFGLPAPGFVQKPEDTYEWLRAYTPVDRVGQSMFVYRLP